MPRCSSEIQYQAFQHPTRSPPASNINVQEKRLGQRLSIHNPISAPSTVGIAIDHPTIPYMPSPNHVPRSRCLSACLRRAARCAIRCASGSSGCSASRSAMRFELHEAADKVRLEARHRAAGVTLALVLGTKFLLDGQTQLAEIVVDDGAPRRHEDVAAVLDEETAV